jgi:N-acetylmuramoyl-L-alanine amidase
MADAKNEGGVGPYELLETKVPVGAMYRVTGTKDNKFWPLDPGHVLGDADSKAFDAFAVPSTTVAKDFVTLVAPPNYGIFDIVIQFSKDSLKPKWVEVEKFREEMRREPLSGTGSADKMYVVVNDEQRARIRFAVHLPKGKDTFKGKVLLEAETVDGDTVKAELKLELNAKQSKKLEDMFVFFVPHMPSNAPDQLPGLQYEWCKLRATDKSGSVIEGATVAVKLLRDNLDGGFEDINRRTNLLSQADGFLGYSAERLVLGMPKDWPLIFRSEMSGYVPRGHLFKIEKKETSTNLTPLYSDPAKTKSNRMQIRMTNTADVNLKGKLIVIDPGHGVMYADRTQAKSQEWLVVHRIADEVADALTSYSASVRFARTAGFEAIAPSHTRRADGPEEARKRYLIEFDTNRWRIKIQNASPEPVNMRLRRLSDVLLDDHSSPPKIEGRRSDLIQKNSATVEQAITRQVDDLKVHLRVEPKSMSWSVADSRFTFRVQREVVVPKHPSTWAAAGKGVFHWLEKAGRYTLKVELDQPSKPESASIAKLSTLTNTHQDWFDLEQ